MKSSCALTPLHLVTVLTLTICVFEPAFSKEISPANSTNVTAADLVDLGNEKIFSNASEANTSIPTSASTLPNTSTTNSLNNHSSNLSASTILPTVSTTTITIKKDDTKSEETTTASATSTTALPSTVTIPHITVTPSPKPTPSPMPGPMPCHRFDGPSFIGGIVLTLGLLTIGMVAYKFYKNHNERNYQTL